MPTLKTVSWIGLIVLLSCSIAPATDLPNAETLTRLQAVYNTTSNAFDRYQAMALRADLDGYAQVATLFRVVARSEQILYTACGDAIKELGAVAQATAEIPDVQSTKENLEKSVKDTEAFERDNAFAVYGKRAKAEGNPQAAKFFEYAKDANGGNLRLFKAALKNLDQMKAPGQGLFVCGVSGFAATAIDPAHCVGGVWERVK